MKCKDKKYKRAFDIYPVSWLGAKLINEFTSVWHQYDVFHQQLTD